MPFREKSAWISLACLVATFGVYYGSIGLGLIESYGFRSLHFFLISALAYLVFRVVLYLIAAATAREDACAPFDEREQLISLKAARNANIALIIGTLLVPMSLHAGLSPPGMAQVAMLALVVAEMVREISRITYFRLG